MSPVLSSRTRAMTGSVTGRAAQVQRRSGAQSWIDLSVGCPDWAPPPRCIEAAVEAARGPQLPYGKPGGHSDLRRKLIEDCHWFEPSSEVESLVTSGGKEALFLALGAALSPGDVVLVCAPFWPSFIEQIRAWGAIPRIVPCDNEGLPQLTRLAAAAEGARAIIVNTPCNPSGRVWPVERFERLAYLARRHDLWVLIDGVYGALGHGDRHSDAAVMLPRTLAERSIVVDSGSKRFALAGLRVGWAVGAADWVRAMRDLQDAVSTHPSLPGQAALAAALDEPATWISDVRVRLRDRACALWRAVQAKPNVSMRLPDAGLFGWIELPAGADDVELVRRLVEDSQLAVLHGSAFGVPRAVRLSLTQPGPLLAEAAARISRAVG